MYLGELDSLPEKFRKGEVTRAQAAMKVMEVVYTNPARFAISDMDEDDRSDFLIDMLPKFELLLERHNENISPFGAYLFFSLPGWKLTWYKKKNEREKEKRIMKSAVQEIYDNVSEKTLLAVATPQSIEKRTHKIEGGASFEKIFSGRATKTREENNIQKKRSAVVLALKSAWYIDDNQIDRISELCDCPKAEIESKVEKIKNSLVERSKKIGKIAEKRDRAWYFICKYREELSHMSKKNPYYRAKKRKLEYQLNSWKNKNAFLSRGRKISADNGMVAKALNVDIRKITAYIRYAKKIAREKESDK